MEPQTYSHWRSKILIGKCLVNLTNFVFVFLFLPFPQKPYKCTYCASAFSQATHLRKHEKVSLIECINDLLLINGY